MPEEETKPTPESESATSAEAHVEQLPGAPSDETIRNDGLGAAKSFITTRSWWASGLEMTMVGAIEAAVTYGLGRAFGAL
jgi:hypothetical protein